MKRRNFLKILLGVAGGVMLPAALFLAEAETCFPSNIKIAHAITINDFGANLTELEAIRSCHSVNSINWHEPDKVFPKIAYEGYCFYFFPETYRGQPLDTETKLRLTGAYIYTNERWLLFGVNMYQ